MSTTPRGLGVTCLPFSRCGSASGFFLFREYVKKTLYFREAFAVLAEVFVQHRKQLRVHLSICESLAMS